MVGKATLTIVMSMMFMNMADTNTVPTTIFWFMRNAGTRLVLTVDSRWSRRPIGTRPGLNSAIDHRRSAFRSGPGRLPMILSGSRTVASRDEGNEADDDVDRRDAPAPGGHHRVSGSRRVSAGRRGGRSGRSW